MQFISLMELSFFCNFSNTKNIAFVFKAFGQFPVTKKFFSKLFIDLSA